MKNRFLKYIAFAISSLLAPLCISCNANSNNKMKIITTIFPEYDWVMNVLGDKKDNFDVSMLLDSGIDLHSYAPTPKDIVSISSCDLFVYVGGESDEWVDDVLKEAKNKEMKVINLMEILGDKAKEEEIIEGMEGEEEEEEEGEEEGPEYDEHVWLSLNNSELFIQAISDNLSILDKDNANYYKGNADTYINNLKALDAEYKDSVSKANKDTLLFADRFPFRYLVDDYSLKYYAAFIGCSAETEASVETMSFLVNKVNELNLKVILKIESSDGKIAETVKKNANNSEEITILTMDSIQSASTKEYAGGRNYLSMMQSNLEVLKKALS